ncbi:MAG TPA: trigger factor, partial [Gemmatimonadaceae bacterium]|nr:trigger factor [Gemmatimonadaceae bacterium]
MKAELVDVNETRKSLSIEVPSDVVSAEIDRVARDYSRKARIPGFRPGKVPARVVKQRFRDQILHDVAHDLVPRFVGEALQEKGVEPVSTPDIREVVLEEGRAMTFTASFDTLPPFEPGDFAALSLARTKVDIADEAVTDALQRLRERAARYDPVEDRGIVDGDIVTVDITRTDAQGGTDTHND